MKEKINKNVAKASKVAAAILLIAILPLSYAYYILLRWLISGIALFLAWTANELRKRSQVFLMIAIALLFNPIFPVYLNKPNWILIDIITVILFLNFNKNIKKY